MTDLKTFNPFDPAAIQCPFPHYAQMRDEAPVMLIESVGMYLVTNHELVMQVLRDPATYSSLFGGASMPLPSEAREKMHRGDGRRLPAGAHHAHRRHARAHPLPPAGVEGVHAEGDRRTRTRDPIDHHTADRLVDRQRSHRVRRAVRRAAARRGDRPRPQRARFDRLADFKRWSDDSIAGIGTNITLEQRLEAERGVNEFQHYFAAELDRRRTEPQDDLLTALLNARVDDDDPEVTDKRELDVPEMLSIIQQLLVAGNETTTKLLTETMRLLAENPDEWTRLKQDPTRASQIVEEALRLSTPTQGMFRISTKDHELGGVHIPEGARLVIVFASANRDESLYPDPDGFDPDRENLRDHLAFGKGIHFCLGAALSRLEGKVALEELSRRLESFSLSETNEYQYFPSFLLRGLTRLDVDIVPAGAA